MKVAAIQVYPKHFDVEHNLNKLLTIIEENDFDIAVAPELALTGYLFESRAQALEYAIEPSKSKEFSAIAHALAKKANASSAHIVIGFAERTAEGNLYNSAALISASGIVGVYRKVHLFDTELEIFDKGNLGFPVFELKELNARIGMMICFDWIFPEAARSLALAGADLIAHPANLVLPYCQRAMPIRALENRVFAITANRIGKETLSGKTLRFTGQSLIVSPRAEIIAEAPESEPAIITAEIDLKEARNKMITPRNHVLSDRRPEMYRLK